MKRELILLVLVASALASISTVAATSNGPEWVADMLYYYSYPTTYPSQIQPGDQGVWVDVEMKNYYTMNYYNVTSELLVSGPFEGVVTKAEINNVKPGETAHAFYQLNIKDDAKPGEYKMRQRMTYYYDYYDEEGVKTQVKVESTKTISINVYYSERIEIENMSVSPGSVLPGDGFEINTTVKNTGSVTVNDVDVSYAVETDSSTVNLMTLSTSTKRIASIKPGQSETVSFPLKAIDTATVQGYKLKVTATYTSGGSQHTESNEIAVNVIGKPIVRMAGVQTDKDTIYAGKPFSLSVQLENIGTGDAKSVKAAIEDSSVKGVLTSYIGTVEVDDTGSAIFNIRDSVEGGREAVLAVSYEDVYGNHYTTNMPLEYFIATPPANYSSVVVALVIAAVLLFLYWRSRKNKKRMEKLVK